MCQPIHIIPLSYTLQHNHEMVAEYYNNLRNQEHFFLHHHFCRANEKIIKKQENIEQTKGYKLTTASSTQPSKVFATKEERITPHQYINYQQLHTQREGRTICQHRYVTVPSGYPLFLVNC